jgi:hypothetical protein
MGAVKPINVAACRARPCVCGRPERASTSAHVHVRGCGRPEMVCSCFSTTESMLEPIRDLDMLTISKLAHHRNIETTRKHYDFFQTQKIVGRMNLGLDAAGFKEGGEAKETIATIRNMTDKESLFNSRKA